jgi:hypothetical protein
MALRVKEYCNIRKCGAEYESVALSLKDYNHNKDDDGCQIDFTLGEMEVEFSSSSGYQSVWVGDLNLDTDAPDLVYTR